LRFDLVVVEEDLFSGCVVVDLEAILVEGVAVDVAADIGDGDVEWLVGAFVRFWFADEGGLWCTSIFGGLVVVEVLTWCLVVLVLAEAVTGSNDVA
jgi:hypothetical protein